MCLGVVKDVMIRFNLILIDSDVGDRPKGKKRQEGKYEVSVSFVCDMGLILFEIRGWKATM